MKHTITAIVGDFFHDESTIRASLEQALEQQGLQGSVSIHYTTYDRLSECLDDAPDAVILFKEDRLNPGSPEVHRWMTPETAGRIADYVRQGGSWLGWHSGLASFEKAAEYIAMLRGHFIMHPREHSEVTYTVQKNELGIHEGRTFAFMDEHYFVECDEANTNVFLRSSSKDGEAIAGWHHSFGEGKVCCLTPAHTIEGLNSPDTAAILGRVLQWIVS